MGYGGKCESRIGFLMVWEINQVLMDQQHFSHSNVVNHYVRSGLDTIKAKIKTRKQK